MAPLVSGHFSTFPPLLLFTHLFAGFGVFPSSGFRSVCCRVSGQDASNGAAFPASALGVCVCVEGCLPSPAAGAPSLGPRLGGDSTDVLLPSPAVGTWMHTTCVTPALAPCPLPGRGALLALRDVRGRLWGCGWEGRLSRRVRPTPGARGADAAPGRWWGSYPEPRPCVRGLPGRSGKGRGGRLHQTSDVWHTRQPALVPQHGP